MNMRGKRFEVDRENGKLLGVCAGLANHTGIDADHLPDRLGAGDRARRLSVDVDRLCRRRSWRRGREAAAPAYAPARVSREESRERMRSIDLRMQAIETYVTSSNSRLAREIEELR